MSKIDSLYAGIMTKARKSKALTWETVFEDEDTYLVSNVMEHEDVPFAIVIEVRNWAETVGESELHPSERTFLKKHGGLYIGFLYLLPKHGPDSVRRLDIPGDVEFPEYAMDAAGYGSASPVMPKGATPGTSTWNTKSYGTPAGAIREAKRYAQNEVVGHIDDVLHRPVNRMGDPAYVQWERAQK